MKQPYAAIAAGTIVAVGVVLLVASVRPEALSVGRIARVEDFGAYWTGTVINLGGNNAYDPNNLAPLQRAIEPDRPTPLPAWSPPWTFAVFTPLAGLPFPAARWVWLIVQLGTVFGTLTALWRVYNGPNERLSVALTLGLLWYPTLQTLGLGQHSSLVLFGVVGWLAGLSAGRPALAGALLALVLVKPQNWHLVGSLVAIWAVSNRAWQMIAGIVGGSILLTAVAMVPNPLVFEQYREALTARPPSEMIPPTLGTLLRLAFGPERFWLAFVPAVGAQVWGIRYYFVNRHHWVWADRLPILLLVSFMTSPYGWVYDQILFLVPLAHVFATATARRPKAVAPMLMVVTGVTTVCLAMNAAKYQEFTFVWLAPLTLVLYCWGTRLAKRTAPTHV
ncbi:glycosyltransferase family 87 protein [Gemmata sp. JC717]|uniref:glycosyltransferase family 87 protein n=1 Tax=Gemmata algarum TaxID=2975278 RepID=UPI0021BBA1F0|nr:glycosyltransferase family 87 protein [Gemmata algarum]MDY3555841.1 glycosyltransferase family 87 protein [Gemmata algarum]